jgi:hypothetical protein
VGGGDVAVAAAVAAATLIIRMNIMFFYVKKLAFHEHPRQILSYVGLAQRNIF